MGCRQIELDGEQTLFTVIVFPPADHEWEKTQEGEGLLEEVLGQEAKFPFNGAKPWMEEKLNRLADDGWQVSVVYPYQFKEQLKLFILRRTITAGRSVARSTCSTTSSWVNERYSFTSSATHPLGTTIRSGRRMSAKKK